MVLEVFTDAFEDKKALDEYYRKIVGTIREGVAKPEFIPR